MDPTLAEIRLFAGNFAPLSWAFCNGALLSIAENTALFSLLGTTYGGDGQTTFALPNFIGRSAIGTGQGPGLSSYDLGQMAGSNSTTLLSLNMPAHNHTGVANVNGSSASASTPAGNYPAIGTGTTSDGKTIQIANSNSAADGATMNGLTINPQGGSQPISVENPYLVLNFIIAVEGIYPSRN